MTVTGTGAAATPVTGFAAFAIVIQPFSAIAANDSGELVDHRQVQDKPAPTVDTVTDAIVY
jgi:hypothetical protein